MNEIQQRIIAIRLRHDKSDFAYRMTETYLQECEDVGRLKNRLTHEQIVDVNDEIFKLTDGRIGAISRVSKK